MMTNQPPDRLAELLSDESASVASMLVILARKLERHIADPPESLRPWTALQLVTVATEVVRLMTGVLDKVEAEIAEQAEEDRRQRRKEWDREVSRIDRS